MQFKTRYGFNKSEQYQLSRYDCRLPNKRLYCARPFPVSIVGTRRHCIKRPTPTIQDRVRIHHGPYRNGATITFACTDRIPKLQTEPQLALIKCNKVSIRRIPPRDAQLTNRVSVLCLYFKVQFSLTEFRTLLKGNY